MGKTDENVKNFVVDQKSSIPKSRPVFDNSTNMPKKFSKPLVSSENNPRAESDRTVAVSNHFSGDLDTLEEKVKSLMEISQNLRANGKQKAYTCKVCGKEGAGSAIKDHIEANHLEGIILPCDVCHKSFRSRNALRLHMRQHILD